MSGTIFTIGYEQATQPALVAALGDAGIEVLADIRCHPLSRQSGRSGPARPSRTASGTKAPPPSAAKLRRKA